MTKEKENIIKSLDDFIERLAPGCEGAIGILKLERKMLINRVRELENENKELKKQK